MVGFVAVEIVNHQKSAAQQKLSQLGRLFVGQHPVPNLDNRIHHGPVVNVVRSVEIDNLLNGSRFNARQPAYTLQKMTI